MENKGGFKEFYKKHKSIFNFIYTVVICFIIAKLITSFVFLSVVVDGSSMYPTLSEGDKAITDGLFFKMGKIERFDIVIVDKDVSSILDSDIVKRVVGLPGETIEYKDSVLYVNGEVVEETFLEDNVKTELLHGGNVKFVLGDDEYVVLGDNRENSTDSRVFGTIKKSDIKGRGFLKFASCKSISNGKCSGLKLNWPTSIK